MYLGKWILLMAVLIGALTIYHWKNYDISWKKTIVKKSVKNWYGSSTVCLLESNNATFLKVFDINNYSLVDIDDWNIQKIYMDDDLKQLELLEINNSVIYIIVTKIPINIIKQYLEKKSLNINNPFILINFFDDKVIIHNYFFDKSMNNNYQIVPLINLNNILNLGMNLQNYLDTYYKNVENVLLYSKNNIENVENLLKIYEKGKKSD